MHGEQLRRPRPRRPARARGCRRASPRAAPRTPRRSSAFISGRSRSHSASSVASRSLAAREAAARPATSSGLLAHHLALAPRSRAAARRGRARAPRRPRRPRSSWRMPAASCLAMKCQKLTTAATSPSSAGLVDDRRRAEDLRRSRRRGRSPACSASARRMIQLLSTGPPAMPICSPFRSASVCAGLSAGHHQPADRLGVGDDRQVLALGALPRHPDPVRDDRVRLAAQEGDLRRRRARHVHHLELEAVRAVEPVVQDGLDLPVDRAGGLHRGRQPRQILFARRGRRRSPQSSATRAPVRCRWRPPQSLCGFARAYQLPPCGSEPWSKPASPLGPDGGWKYGDEGMDSTGAGARLLCGVPAGSLDRGRIAR